MGMRHLRSLFAFAVIFVSTALSVRAQAISGQSLTSPITLREAQTPVLTAEAPRSFANPTVLPTDVTPITRGAARALLSRQLRFHLMKRLPTRLWFSLNTEITQRYESNVFFTYSHHRGDYVFRAAPNITVGYNILPHTSIYTNYFVIKDVFAKHTELTFPTTQSLSLGVRHDVPLGRKASAQFDFQARELWQSVHLHQADFLPSVNLTYAVRPNTYLFGSLLLQLRGKNYFVCPTREIDPFYTIGGVYQRGRWAFTATDTFITNFRSPPFNDSIPRQGNVNMIADFEVSHPVVNKIPGLVAFVRVEPVWNWGAHKQIGLSGFDIRVFGGLRLAVNKQSYLSSIENLRQQLMEQEKEMKQPAPQPKKQSTSRPPDSEHQSSAMPVTSMRQEKSSDEPMAMVLRQPPPAPDEFLKSEPVTNRVGLTPPPPLF